MDSSYFFIIPIGGIHRTTGEICEVHLHFRKVDALFYTVIIACKLDVTDLHNYLTLNIISLLSSLNIVQIDVQGVGMWEQPYNKFQTKQKQNKKITFWKLRYSSGVFFWIFNVGIRSCNIYIIIFLGMQSMAKIQKFSSCFYCYLDYFVSFSSLFFQ